MTTMIYSTGLCYASVCTDDTDEAATATLNQERPTGVGPWQIADESFRDGTPNPAPCNDTPGRRHILFIC